MNISDILAATVGGIFVIFILLLLACGVGMFIAVGMYDKEEDRWK